LAQHAAPPGNAPNPGPELTDAEAFSAAAGKVVGAASACDAISKDRVTAATKKAASITSSVVQDDDELASAQELFIEGTDVGKTAVESGSANCNTVEMSLARLEQFGDE
jgi:hypothetical protein